MTTATVFNAYDVTQTAGPANTWVDNGSSEVAFPYGMGGTTFTYTFIPISGYVVTGMTSITWSGNTGDTVSLSINGGGYISVGPGPYSENFAVTELNSVSFIVSNYDEYLHLVLNDAELVPGFTPLWTEYRNTMEYEL
jgi:hypothetical protein